MLNPNKTQAAREVNAAITNALKERIPYYAELRADAQPSYVYQSDLFGYTDTIIQMASERLYKNQNKSRSDDKDDICIECRGYRGPVSNIQTGETVPIAGAIWCDGWQRWLSPVFGQSDTLTFYLPKVNFVGHYNRYFLEIMLSKAETWKHATGVFKKAGEAERYIVFFNYKAFNRLYLDTVTQTTYGESYDDGLFASEDPETYVVAI